MASERTSHLTQTSWEEKKKGKGIKGENFKERSSTISLNFLAIGPTVPGGARGKAHPRGKSFASRSESGSFEKLQEVGVFLLPGLVFG